jgi:hypothetical protein
MPDAIQHDEEICELKLHIPLTASNLLKWWGGVPIVSR